MLFITEATFVLAAGLEASVAISTARFTKNSSLFIQHELICMIRAM
jgi:hypothetical protein